MTNFILSIDNLFCPICKSKFSVLGGNIVCKNGHKYPISGKVISFIEDSNFDDHWRKHSINDIPVSKLAVAGRFLTPLLKELEPGQAILDAGCGDGVHAEYLNRNFKSIELTYLGMDISLEALGSAKNRCTGGTFLHADVNNIPIQTESMDAAFSYGVIAYTNSPQDALIELTRVVKTNGLVGIWLYPDPGGLKSFLFKTVRAITKVLGPVLTARMADLIVPLLAFLPVASGVNLKNATWKQCREVVLVNIAPAQLCFPDVNVIKKWFDNAGLDIIYEDKEPLITIWAKKK